MIAALVLFPTEGSTSLLEATERFEMTAPNYRDRDGLHSKAYIFGEDDSELGGFYLWESREAAESLYTDVWKARAREIYGVDPIIRFFEVPILIENHSSVVNAEV